MQAKEFSEEKGRNLTDRKGACYEFSRKEVKESAGKSLALSRGARL